MAAQVEGRFFLNKDSYAVGEPLLFSVEIKNTGSETVFLFPKTGAQCSDSISLWMHSAKPNQGMACGTSWVTCLDDPTELKPGQIYSPNWPLDFWYRIEHEGVYTTNLTGHARFSGLRGGIQEITFSSELQLKVVPGNPDDVRATLEKFQADLQSKDIQVRHHALDVLATIAPDYFHDETLRLARDPDAFNVMHAASALARMNTPEARAALAEILTRPGTTDNDRDARDGAIQGLGDSGDPSYMQMLIPFAEKEGTRESDFAVIAIGKLGQGSAVPLLQGYLRSPSPEHRIAVAYALRFTVAPEAVDVLIDTLRDNDANVRQKVADNLAELTGHSVVQPGSPAPAPQQLENLWRVWWQKNGAQTKLVAPNPFVCRM